MSDHHFLKEIFKPEKFSRAEWEQIVSQFKAVTLKKQDYFIRENEISDYYFFLESGYARSYAIDTEGKDITTNFFSKTDIIIDWRSYFLKTPSAEYIQALSPCTAWKIYFHDFMKLFNIEAFREVGRTRLVKNYFDLKNHTTSMITDEAKERYLQLLSQKPDIIQNVPLKHIATYLGITDTSLSRIRKEIWTTKNS